ncbi:MAG: hypothetical protein CMJ18_13680, partial [Phycisphaeraceae bacterium]|nr:hypothetical protein [Phycisphaeraceae bacterium]
GSDLFDTILVTENYPAAPQESPLDIADVYYDAHSSFPLALIIIPGDRLRLLLIRDAARYSDRTVERMLDHLEALLGAMGDDDDPRLGDLPRLGAVERHRLEIEWNDTARPAPDDRDLVPRQIEHRAAAHPKAAAVIHEGRTLTYGQLMERADAMARGLRRMNVGRGDRVGICMNRSPEMIVGILAALKAGAAYVPLDPTYPAARLAHMIDDACLAVLITRERLQPTIGDVSCRVACIESEALNVAPDTTDTEAVTLEPDDLAYVIYTSGSTGTPRGVMVSHANLWHSTTARSAYYEEPVGCFLLLSSFSFDSSVAGLFWTLTQGGAICIPAEARAIDTPYLCALIEKCGVTHLLGIASFYQQLLETGATQLEGLKVAIVAGEACPADLPAEHHRLLPGTRLFNEYGPTEASVWCTVHESTAAAPGDGVPIGRPIANTRLYVLDAHRDMVPIGVPGELHVAGAGITRGYWNDPERTEQRFLPDPFASNGARMYRTGDLVRYDDDGILEFLGRTDDQVKIRGHRVEPGEIESALSARADVSEAVVVATDMTDRPEADVGALESRLGRLEPDEATRLLEQIERQGGDTGAPASGRTRRTRDYELILRMRSDAFVATPRPSQRQWLVDQLLNEAAEDLEHLDRIAGNLVPGTDATTKSFEAERTALDDQQIMEDWQVPVMKAMAEQVTRSHGDVLEIGFGRGVSAGFIQDCGVRSHTIVEVNDHSVTAHFEPWRARLADRDIRLVHGRWQDHEDEIGLFDGIFFHAFPLNEQEYVEHVINSITFAGHFFPTASKHLKPGGTFTYLTTEIDSLSRRHQRLILQHFDSYTASLIRLKIPENTQDTWWADSMVIIRAEKAAGV